MINKQDETTEKTDTEVARAFWGGPAVDAQARAWRRTHKMTIAGILKCEEGQQVSTSYFYGLYEMAHSLTRRQNQNLGAREPEISAVDEQHIFRYLGAALAKRANKPGSRRKEFDPLICLLEQICHCWVTRACEGGIINDPLSGSLVWKSRPHPNEVLLPHWTQDLTEKVIGKKRRFDRQTEMMKPWSTLRVGLETFLEAWSKTLGDDRSDAIQNTLAKPGMTYVGASCLALRTMTAIVPRKMASKTAYRLQRLEEWMGEGSVRISEDLAATQQVVWERYLLERKAQEIRKSSSSRLIDNDPPQPGQGHLVRRRKM